MAKHGIWMPMYWGDYLADTMHLNTFQHGAYLLLIAAYWQRGGPIPGDPASIARMCKTTQDKVARWLKPVVAMFACKDGLLHHQRIDFELSRSSDRLAAAVANGKAGGLAKSKLSTTTVSKILPFNVRKETNGGKGPAWNLSMFQKKLAEDWGVGWEIVGCAADPDHPEYHRCLNICQQVAAQNGKGWPHQWPKGAQNGQS